MFRLFVGIVFPEDVRFRLAALRFGLPGAKWIDAENMHLTVRFIGEVGGAQAEDIDMALARVSAPAFNLVISGIDCFESGGKVHTLWAGIEKQPLLAHLYGKVESALVRAGCEPDKRKFKPHVTLARLRGGGGSRIASFIQAYNRLAIGPFAVDRFTLFGVTLAARKRITRNSRTTTWSPAPQRPPLPDISAPEGFPSGGRSAGEKFRQVGHIGEHPRRAGIAKHGIVTGRAITRAGEAKYLHSSGAGGGHAGAQILHHDTVFRRDAHLL